jgi:hypothetical protein
MPPWSIAETKLLVTNLHGGEHLSRIEPSLHAMSQRQRYARFHFQEVGRLLADFQEAYLKTDILLSVTHGQEEEPRAAFDEFMMKAGAHVVACVLSIHSIADVTAFAVYLALDYQSNTSIRREKDVTAAVMRPLLAANPQHQVLADALARLMSNPEFMHISALSNHSKHRGLIKPLLNEDWTGTRETAHEVRFANFSYDQTTYPEAEIASVLAPAYEAASTAVVTVGNEINVLLSTSAA